MSLFIRDNDPDRHPPRRARPVVDWRLMALVHLVVVIAVGVQLYAWLEANAGSCGAALELPLGWASGLASEALLGLPLASFNRWDLGIAKLAELIILYWVLPVGVGLMVLWLMVWAATRWNRKRLDDERSEPAPALTSPRRVPELVPWVVLAVMLVLAVGLILPNVLLPNILWLGKDTVRTLGPRRSLLMWQRVAGLMLVVGPGIWVMRRQLRRRAVVRTEDVHHRGAMTWSLVALAVVLAAALIVPQARWLEVPWARTHQSILRWQRATGLLLLIGAGIWAMRRRPRQREADDRHADKGSAP